MGFTQGMHAHARLPGWLLVPLVGVALLVRSIGLDFDLPTTHLDGTVVAAQTEMIRTLPSEERKGPLWQFYPLLLAYSSAALPVTDAQVPVVPERRAQVDWPLEEHLDAAGATWMRVRKTSTLLSLLLIPAAFLLARRFLGPWASLLAAALVATSLLHLEIGTRVRPHGLAASAIAISVLLALWLRRRGSLVRYGVAATGAGLALGSLQYGIFALPASGLAGLLARGASKGRKALGFVLALVVIGACVRLLYPFHFGASDEFLSMKDDGFDLSGQPLKLHMFNGSGFRRVAIYLWSYEPALFVLGFCGLVTLLLRWLRGLRLSSEAALDAWVVAACYGGYLAVIGAYAESWERFLLPLLPVFGILAAVPVAALARRLQAPVLGLALGVAALAFPAYCQAKLVSLRAADSTLDQASAVIAEELKPGRDRLALLSYSHVNLGYHPKAIAMNREERFGSLWQRYQFGLPGKQRDARGYVVMLPQGSVAEVRDAMMDDVFRYLAEVKARYVLVPVDPKGVLQEARWSAREQLRAALEPIWTGKARAKHEHAALPYQMTRKLPWDHSFVGALLSTQALGPTYELYRVPPKLLSKR